MIEVNKKQLKDWKQAMAKAGIAYETDDEYREALQNLEGYFDILIQMDLTQRG